MEGASYRTIRTGGTFEVTEKKSRFIGEAGHAENEEEALAFLETIRKKHYDAKHHCFAFIGNGGAPVRSSDDGEPQAIRSSAFFRGRGCAVLSSSSRGTSAEPCSERADSCAATPPRRRGRWKLLP